MTLIMISLSLLFTSTAFTAKLSLDEEAVASRRSRYKAVNKAFINDKINTDEYPGE